MRARLESAGVEIVQPIRLDRKLNLKSFFVMGPDRVTIEIVEAKPIPEGPWDDWIEDPATSRSLP